MGRLGLTFAALGALVLAAPSAGAATLPMTLTAGTTYTLKLDGTVGGGTTQDNTGLYSVIQLTYNGLTSGGTVADFDYAISNQSSVPSRLSAFGFNTTPEVTGASGTGLFTKFLFDKNIGNSTQVEVCATEAGPGNNCTGGGGLSVGGSSSGDLLLTFASAVTSFSLDGLFVKWQSLANGGSAVGGVFDVTTPPEGGNTPVPGPIAGAGIPALMAAGALLWTRRRKVAA